MRVACVLATFVLPVIASGHHSDAGLDLNSVVVLEGTVAEFNWRNPHVYFTIESTDRSGQSVEWELQTVAIPILVRSGWNREALSVGDRVVARGHPALDGRNYALLLSIEKDGEVLVPVKLAESSGTAARAATLR